MHSLGGNNIRHTEAWSPLSIEGLSIRYKYVFQMYRLKSLRETSEDCETIPESVRVWQIKDYVEMDWVQPLVEMVYPGNTHIAFLGCFVVLYFRHTLAQELKSLSIDGRNILRWLINS